MPAPLLPCHACVVYGLSPGRRPEPHPRPGHVLQEQMARVMRDDGKTRRPSLALGCIDMRSCTDHRHAHTGLTARLRSASDDGNRRNGNRRDRQQNGTALDPMHPTHSPAPHGSSFRLCVGFTTLTSPRSIAPARALALVRSGERRTRADLGLERRSTSLATHLSDEDAHQLGG